MPDDKSAAALAAIGNVAEIAAAVAPLLNGSIKLPGERVAELSLQFAIKLLDVSRDLSDDIPLDVKQQFWRWAMEDQRRWRKFWGLGD